MINKNIIKIFIIFPLILLSVNTFNFFFPKDYRSDPHLIKGYISKENQKIINYISNQKRNEILKFEEAIKKFDKLYSLHGETFKFLKEASIIYFLSTAPQEYSWKKKYTKIKFQENWILYLVRKFDEVRINFGFDSIYNNAYDYYQSSDYKFALKRGISICSQDAISFANLIKRKYNIDYDIIGMDGHVVLQANIKDKNYILDPNKGLAFKFSIDEYYHNAENQFKIKEAYTSIGHPNLINSFDQEGNRKFNYTGPKVKENTYNPDALTYYSSFMKWLIPIFFLLVGIYLIQKRKKL